MSSLASATLQCRCRSGPSAALAVPQCGTGRAVHRDWHRRPLYLRTASGIVTEKRRAQALGPGRDHYEPPVSVSFWQSRSWRPAARSAGESVALHCQWQWLSAADLVRLGVTVTVTVGPAGGPAAATVLAGPGTDSEFLDAGATDCQLELQEHIYVISTGYTLNKILIIYIYLVYPTPTFCLQKWVEPVGWCSKSGAGPAAQKQPTMVDIGGGLPCLQRNFFLTGTRP